MAVNFPILSKDKKDFRLKGLIECQREIIVQFKNVKEKGKF